MVLGIPNLAKRGKTCPGWSYEKLQRKQQLSGCCARVARRDLGSDASSVALPEVPSRPIRVTAASQSEVIPGEDPPRASTNRCPFALAIESPRPVEAAELEPHTESQVPEIGPEIPSDKALADPYGVNKLLGRRSRWKAPFAFGTLVCGRTVCDAFLGAVRSPACPIQRAKENAGDQIVIHPR